METNPKLSEESIKKTKNAIIYSINTIFIAVLTVLVGFQLYREMNTQKTTAKLVSFESVTSTTTSKCGNSNYWFFEIVEDSKPNIYKTIISDCGFDRPLNQPMNILYKPKVTQSVIIDDFSRWMPIVTFSVIVTTLSSYSIFTFLSNKFIHKISKFN